MIKPKKGKKAVSSAASAEKRRSVEEAAYYRWLNRGSGHGRDFNDWLDAEEDIAENIFDRDPED